MVGIHWYDVALIFSTIIPILVGLFWIAPDARRRGQPGWLWALLTIPFGWITVLVYAVLRRR
jgi:hypothetical protein